MVTKKMRPENGSRDFEANLIPKVTKMEAKATQREPKGTQKAAKYNQMMSKGSQRATKMYAKKHVQKRIRKVQNWDDSQHTFELRLDPLSIKSTTKNHWTNRCLKKTILMNFHQQLFQKQCQHQHGIYAKRDIFG